jgi:hypothetical protein
MKKIRFVLFAFVLLALVACDSTPPKPAAVKTPAPPEYVTGRTAFQSLYVSARAFGADVKPYQLQSIYTPGSPAAKGEAAIWYAGFASPSKRQLKVFTMCGITADNAPERGITHSTEDTYSASNTSTLVWELPFLKIDSDKAYEVAQKQGGEKLTAKDPNQPVTFILDWDSRRAALQWHVIYGVKPMDAKLHIIVDATSGAYVKTEH